MSSGWDYRRLKTSASGGSQATQQRPPLTLKRLTDCREVLSYLFTIRSFDGIHRGTMVDLMLAVDECMERRGAPADRLNDSLASQGPAT